MLLFYLQMISELTDTRREREKKQEESELEEQTGHRTTAPTLDTP